jgi:TrkA domain protein
MDILETALPGVGLRHEFTTRDGHQRGVVSYRTGRRDLLLYDRDDPDACQEVIRLTDDEADTQARSRTGVSIVAVLRAQTAFPAPTPRFGFQAGDTAVVVGTPAGVRALARLLDG